MDPTEDLSARVLLKHILTTEPPKTPVTRSGSKSQSTSNTRRSNRLANKDAGAQTPRDVLRRSFKHKIQESITRKSLPATKRRTASVVLRKVNIPAPTSMLLDDGDTPRHILRNILRTEPARSPVVHERAASQEPQPSSANYSISSKRPSIELSGLDLPDITIGNAASIAKGLSRKRPRRSLNVTAFEKRLGDGDDVEEDQEESIGSHSSLSLSSSTSLSLKTPFVDVRTEKRGLQRRVSNRRKITEEEFGAAVNKRQMGGASSFVQMERGLSETAYSEGFTLGLSKLSEPDITTDIVHCNTALYAQPDAMTSNFSIVATQDKPTVMASQLQRQMEPDEPMEAEQQKEKSTYAFPTEGVVAEPQNEECFSQLEEDATEAISQKQEGESTADSEPDDDAAMSKSEEEEGAADSQASVRGDTAESEEEENRVAAQTEEEGAGDSQTEEDAATRSQFEEEEVVPDSQTEEEGAASQPEEDAAAMSLSEEEEVVPDSQTEEEEEGAASQPEEDAAATLLSEEEEVVQDSQTAEEEEGAVNSQSEEEEVVQDSQTAEEEEGAVNSQSEEEEVAGQSDQEEPAEVGLADSPPDDESDGGEAGASEQLDRDLEHISRRAHRSEAGLFMPVTEAGWSDGKSKAHSTFDLHNSLEIRSHESSQLHAGVPDLSESSTQGGTDASCAEAKPDNSFHLPEVTQDIKDSHGEAAAQEPAERDEEWEDDEEESEEFPSKTPAFVRQKRSLFRPDPPASPSVLKNIQASGTSKGEGLPAPKPKQVRKTRTGPVIKEAGLPKSYLMGVFKHFAKTKVSADVYPVLKEIMDKFFERMAEDLETYAVHAKRKTLEVEDVELLLKRQGHVNDKVPVEVLIEKYLRMDQRKLLIPIATSGNVVIPKKRR